MELRGKKLIRKEKKMTQINRLTFKTRNAGYKIRITL